MISAEVTENFEEGEIISIPIEFDLFGSKTPVKEIQTIPLNSRKDINTQNNPQPKKEGKIVYPYLVEWIENQKFNRSTNIKLSKLVNDRFTLGMQKYRQPLMTLDGRNTVKDYTDELMDALFYGMKAKMNGDSMKEFRELLEILQRLVD